MPEVGPSGRIKASIDPNNGVGSTGSALTRTGAVTMDVNNALLPQQACGLRATPQESPDERKETSDENERK